MRACRFIMRNAVYLLLFLLIACGQQPVRDSAGEHLKQLACTQSEKDIVIEPPVQIPDAVKPTATSTPAPALRRSDFPRLLPADWRDLKGFENEHLRSSWSAWLLGCEALKNQPMWQALCAQANQMQMPSDQEIRTFFKDHFDVYQATNEDGSDTGLITGYYEPILRGSRTKSDTYRYPLYSRPDDLVTIDLGEVYPDLLDRKRRARLVDKSVVPYYSRAEIDVTPSPLAGKELVYIDDIIDVFFLHIQGSGKVQLDDGTQLDIGYADQNGHPFQSMGQYLIAKGALTYATASMQGIKKWARSHLDEVRDALNHNPSYVFFRELPAGLPGPIGALQVPILAENVVAVDKRFIPLGAPVFLSTTYPLSSKPLQKLVMAQDTGGAIKGGVRADFFWGAGEAAGQKAGQMKQRGKMWVLMPKDFALLP